VLSRRTRGVDEGEKRDAYLTIPSLSVYMLIEQEAAAIVAFRRTATGFVREVYLGLDAVIPLGEIGIELPLADINENVELGPEPGDNSAELMTISQIRRQSTTGEARGASEGCLLPRLRLGLPNWRRTCEIHI
jgi:hypothetical protein